MSKDISVIALTGAPSSGKSTSLAKICEHFLSHGFRVFTVPETATILLTNGLSFKEISQDQLFIAQCSMIKSQLALEDSFYDIAKSTGEKSIIICDRGAVDPAAFISPTLWQAVLDETNNTQQKLYNRYDAVIHLGVSTKYYTTANNAARSETPEQAIQVDERLRKVWLGHSHLRVIESCEDFNHKISNVIAAISRVVGIPEPIEIERKYLISQFDINKINIPYSAAEIEQTYLISPNNDEVRIRKRGGNGSFYYTHTVKKDAGYGKKIELEYNLSPKEYLNLLNYADPKRKTIKKTRYCFLYNNQYFELDEYFDITPKYVLEIELNTIEQKVELPPFIVIEKEITGDKEYSNYYLSRNKE